MSDSHIVNDLDEIFSGEADQGSDVKCTGEHPPCKCAWKKIAIRLGYTDVKTNTIKSQQRRRERQRQGELSARRRNPPKIESQKPTDSLETLQRIEEMLKQVKRVNVMPPPERPKPQDQRHGKGGIALP
tara:strand:- start:828 stop:1214 length:387 start_codon:yes stop_codon:yes gene_type:complete